MKCCLKQYSTQLVYQWLYEHLKRFVVTPLKRTNEQSPLLGALLLAIDESKFSRTPKAVHNFTSQRVHIHLLSGQYHLHLGNRLIEPQLGKDQYRQHSLADVQRLMEYR